MVKKKARGQTEQFNVRSARFSSFLSIFFNKFWFPRLKLWFSPSSTHGDMVTWSNLWLLLKQSCFFESREVLSKADQPDFESKLTGLRRGRGLSKVGDADVGVSKNNGTPKS